MKSRTLIIFAFIALSFSLALFGLSICFKSSTMFSFFIVEFLTFLYFLFRGIYENHKEKKSAAATNMQHCNLSELTQDHSSLRTLDPSDLDSILENSNIKINLKNKNQE